MRYSTNYNMKKPELNEQYRLEHWNDNTDIIDAELKRNADNIETAETALQNISNPIFKTALLNFCYPIGSLYWSSKSDNPSTLFGGTWVQIKDRFIWAKGDSDTVNATGGAKTVQLNVNNLPSHNHTCSSTNIEHGHFGTTGLVSSKYGSANTGGMNENQEHTHDQLVYTGGKKEITNIYGGTLLASNRGRTDSFGYAYQPSYEGDFTGYPYNRPTNINHSHNFDHAHDFATGGMSANVSHSHTISGGGNGTANGNAHENMPPYIVKYCWERTA